MSYLDQRPESINSGSNLGDTQKPVAYISQERYKRSNTDQSPNTDRSTSSISVSERLKFGISQNPIVKPLN